MNTDKADFASRSGEDLPPARAKKLPTRGPWVAIEVGQGGPADAPMPIYEIQPASGTSVIAEYVDGNNAALLAAAPDMLAALMDAEPMLAAMLKEISTTLPKYSQMPALNSVRAAIAKATGAAA